jgi:hypothetical protein
LISTNPNHANIFIDKAFKNRMDQLFQSKSKTHRSCFRKVFATLISVEEIKEKNAQQLIDDHPEIFGACEGK